MNVAQLKLMLNKYPDAMEIINERCSDYDLVKEDEWSVVKGVDKDGYIMRSHETMSDENKKNMKEYLLLKGN